MALAKSRFSSDAGFSLMEVLIAMGVMAVGSGRARAAVRDLDRANHSSKTTTFAAMLAQQKMEQLRGLTWGFDTVGLPISDVTHQHQRCPAARRLSGAEQRGAGQRPVALAGGTLGGNVAGLGGLPRHQRLPAGRRWRRTRTGPSTSAAGRSSRCRPIRTTRSSFRCSSRAASIAARPTTGNVMRLPEEARADEHQDEEIQVRRARSSATASR